LRWGWLAQNHSEVLVFKPPIDQRILICLSFVHIMGRSISFGDYFSSLEIRRISEEAQAQPDGLEEAVRGSKCSFDDFDGWMSF
jgi:hypothetical protein